MMFLAFSFALVSDAVSETAYPLPPKQRKEGTPEITIQPISNPGNVLIAGLMRIAGRPFDLVNLTERYGDVPLYWLTDTSFAYESCSDRLEDLARGRILIGCKSLRMIGDVTGKKYVIELPGFVSGRTWPVFFKSRMAYQSLLEGGTIGCEVYDWETTEFLLRWDTKYKWTTQNEPFWGRPHFSSDGHTVTCKVSEGWEKYMTHDGTRWKPAKTIEFSKPLTRQ